jgi:hypothetical protein
MRPIISERAAMILSVGGVVMILAWHKPEEVGITILCLFFFFITT